MDTALEWLELQFEKYTRAGVQVPNDKLFKLTEKAKQKEKEQIINAYNQADLDGYFQKTYPKYAEEYYNQTYNQ